MFSHLITLTELLELELNDFWCLFISFYITQSKIKSGLPSPPPHPSNRPSNSLLQFELPGDCSQNGWMSPLSPQNMTTSFSQFPKTNHSDFPRVLSCLPAPSPIQLAGKTVCSKTVRLCPRTWLLTMPIWPHITAMDGNPFGWAPKPIFHQSCCLHTSWSLRTREYETQCVEGDTSGDDGEVDGKASLQLSRRFCHSNI